jgi:glutaredoxin
LTGEWCPFSVTAASFWGDIAEEVGIELQVVSIESEKGERLSASINATGVPCLIVSQDKVIYGVLHDRRYAKKILHSLLKNA